MSDQQLTAGAYLRKRREAAGLSIDEVAAGCAMPPNRVDFALRLARIEADEQSTSPMTLAALRGAFRFNRQIFADLAAGLPAGTMLCRDCACSWHDACIDLMTECYWAEEDLCSRCTNRPASTREPVFTLSARDPDAIAMVTITGFMRLGRWDDARQALADAISASDLRRRRGPPDSEDIAAGDHAFTRALEMTHWRRDALGALNPGELVHV